MHGKGMGDARQQLNSSKEREQLTTQQECHITRVKTHADLASLLQRLQYAEPYQ